MKIHTLTLVAIAAAPLLSEASQTRQPDNLIERQKPPALRLIKAKPVKKAPKSAIIVRKKKPVIIRKKPPLMIRKKNP